jgi:hypothetical protein
MLYCVSLGRRITRFDRNRLDAKDHCFERRYGRYCSPTVRSSNGAVRFEWGAFARVGGQQISRDSVPGYLFTRK